MAITKDRTKVDTSPTGGTIWVPIEHGMCMVSVSQRYTRIEDGKLIVTTRKAQIVQGDGLLKLEPGQMLAGDIYVKESIFPLDHEDIEVGLLWKEDGTVDRSEEGHAIYQYTVYDENENGDEIVPRVKATADHQ